MCNKCQTNGHFSNLCRGGQRSTCDDKSKTRDKTPKVNEVKSKEPEKEKNTDEGQIGTLSGSWFFINGIHEPPSGGTIYEDSDVFTSELRQGSSDPFHYDSVSALNSKVPQRKIRHHIIDNFGRWVPSNVQPHGKIKLTVSTDPSAQKQLNLPTLDNDAVTSVWELADMGAPMCVADWAVAKSLICLI